MIIDWLKRLPGAMTGQVLMMFVHGLTGVRALWRGSLPEARQRVYFANHSSHGDFVLIWITLPGHMRRATRPVAARDYWTASPLRRFLGSQVINAVLIDRAQEPGTPSPVDVMAEALHRGESLIIFPEGTRNEGETPLLPFKSGLYHLGRSCPHVELIPVWLDNVRRVMPKGQWVPVPMACTVSYGPALALEPDEDKASFIRRAEASVLALRPQESTT